MDLQVYNRSYEEIIETFDEEAESRLRSIRQECLRDFVTRITSRQQEWESTFQDILNRSQEDQKPDIQDKKYTNAAQPVSSLFGSINLTNQNNPLLSFASIASSDVSKLKEEKPEPTKNHEPILKDSDSLALQATTQKPPEPRAKPLESKQPIDQVVDDFVDREFSNITLIEEFIRLQEVLETTRQSCQEISTNPSLKLFKNELNLFIRTQINSISNSDDQHLQSKISLMTSLFSGQKVTFQGRIVDASLHPQGQLFALDLAAQTFVTVGTRLVNSVPAIAKSMSSVICGIIDRNFKIFRDLIIGHLQERCPYLVPRHPNPSDFKDHQNSEVKFKIACGYSYDSKSQTLESEDKYISRMRSMALIYSCLLVQDQIGRAWSWLAALVSLRPQPIITAVVLQAFLQESSKKLSSAYGHQYKKLIEFIRSDYVAMIEKETTEKVEKQSLIKLKNLLSDDINLFASPTISSIFSRLN